MSGCANERVAQWGPIQHLGAGTVNGVALEARGADSLEARGAALLEARGADLPAARGADLPAARGPATTVDTAGSTPLLPLRKTLGGKMLSAMALERVTGRKPDPSRLREVD
ncbi:MAG: hypothetical protein ABL908_20345 [Hyphomicrobium sp.]